MSRGAQPGHAVSDETKRKISASMTGVKQGPSPLRGRPQSAEWIAKRATAVRRYDSDVCSVDGCGRARLAKGMCSLHYERMRRYGDPLLLPTPRTNANHPRWKGDAIAYDTAHRRARKNLAASCLVCHGTSPRLEVALLHTAPTGRLKTSKHGKPYSTDPADYVTLCVKCHRQYDSPVAETRAGIETSLGAVVA